MTPDDVGKRSEVIARNEREHDRIWKAALDKAAAECDKVMECKAAARIRELKK